MVVHPGPAYSVADVHRGWVKGLKANGVTVADVNLDDRLHFYEQAHVEVDGECRRCFDHEGVLRLLGKSVLADAFQFWPQLVLVTSGFFVLPDVLDALRSRGMKVAVLHTESPYEDERQIRVSEHADFNLVNDPVNLDRFAGDAWYSPHGYDPTVHHPRPANPKLKSDFCFVGTGYRSRLEFFEAVDWDGVDALFGGNWQMVSDTSPLLPFLTHERGECCPNEYAVDLYSSTKCSANLYRREVQEGNRPDGWSMGPREVELAASGTFFLRDPRGESDQVLGMLPTFTDPADFSEKLRWWLTHDSTREEATEKAQAAVVGRTFKNLAADLLKRL